MRGEVLGRRVSKKVDAIQLLAEEVGVEGDDAGPPGVPCHLRPYNVIVVELEFGVDNWSFGHELLLST